MKSRVAVRVDKSWVYHAYANAGWGIEMLLGLLYILSSSQKSSKIELDSQG